LPRRQRGAGRSTECLCAGGGLVPSPVTQTDCRDPMTGDMSGRAELLRRFGADECGAVAIDWVAITSGILLMGIMVVYSIFGGGVASLTEEINLSLAAVGSDITANYTENSDSGGSTEPAATGNAAPRACDKTQKFVVCFGNK